MAGYDDPRFLQQVITELQQKVKKLEAASIPFLANQRGAIPGAMRAVQIGDPNQKSAMWVNLIGNQAGSAPYQAVTDANGTVRVEFGNLAARGVSAAQLGWRANDANGVPIADAIGLSQVMSQLGRGDQAFGFSYTNNTTSYTAITGDSVTFSLIRAARVLALFVVVFQSLTAGVTGEVDLFADGVNIPDAPTLNNADSTCWTSTSAITTATNFYTATLAAGSHTIDLRGRVQSAGNTLQVNGSTIIVFLQGT